MSGLLLTCLAMVAQQVQASLTLDFASNTGSTISFDGSSHFTFVNTSGSDFHINDPVGTPSLGALGSISIGAPGFTIGKVTTASTPFGNLESAPVSGTGSLTISDGSGGTFQGTVVWNDLTSLGTLNGLNLSGNLNLSTLSYNGTKSDLLALLNAGAGSAAVSFQFTPAMDVSSLKTTACEAILGPCALGLSSNPSFPSG
jgi:hypothetical protein